MTNDNSPLPRVPKFELSEASQATFEKDDDIGGHLKQARATRDLVPNIHIVKQDQAAPLATKLSQSAINSNLVAYSN